MGERPAYPSDLSDEAWELVRPVPSPRRQLVRETGEEPREQTVRLAEQLAAGEEALKRLQITRETVLELAAEGGTGPPGVLPPGYRAILAVIEAAGEGLRAKGICRALGLGAESRRTDGTRARLKRLVGRGILTEPEVGLFTLTHPAPVAPQANSRWTPARAR